MMLIVLCIRCYSDVYKYVSSYIYIFTVHKCMCVCARAWESSMRLVMLCIRCYADVCSDVFLYICIFTVHMCMCVCLCTRVEK